MGKEEETDQIKVQTSIPIEVKDDDPEVPKNKEKEAEKDKNEFKNAILVVATLLITLACQGLVNPPSSFFKHGTEIEWGCIFRFLVSPESCAYGVSNNLKRCPAFLPFYFLWMNTRVFFEGIMLLMLGFHRGGGFKFHFMLQLLTLTPIWSYRVLLAAFSDSPIYVAILLGGFTLLFQLLLVLAATLIRYADAPQDDP